MKARVIILFCVFFSPLVFCEDILVILKTGKELFGTIVMETSDGIIIRRNGKLESYKEKDIKRWVHGKRIDTELASRRKKIKKGDAASLLRLALLALEVQKKKLALELVTETMHCLSPKPASGAVPAAEKDQVKKTETSVPKELPWPPAKDASVKLEVKKKNKGKISDDPAAWSLISTCLESADPPFSVILMNSSIKGDYIFRIGFALRISKVNKMFDSVPISNEWECVVRLMVRSGKTGKILHSVVLPAFRKSCSVNLGGEKMIMKEGIDGLLAYLKRTPAFRLRNVPK